MGAIVLCQYIVRAPVSLEKLYWDCETDTVLWHAPKKGLFRGEDRYFSGLDFIAQLTLTTVSAQVSRALGKTLSRFQKLLRGNFRNFSCHAFSSDRTISVAR